MQYYLEQTVRAISGSSQKQLLPVLVRIFGGLFFVGCVVLHHDAFGVPVHVHVEDLVDRGGRFGALLIAIIIDRMQRLASI